LRAVTRFTAAVADRAEPAICSYLAAELLDRHGHGGLVPSPKLAPLELTAQERQTLTGWTRRRQTSQALAMRSQIVLGCAGAETIGAVAAELGVSRDKVSKWRSRLLRDRLDGLDGLADEPRLGRLRTIADERVELVITKTLESAGPVKTHTGRPVSGGRDGTQPVGGIADPACVRP
jgi:Winged helix-turn helix